MNRASKSYLCSFISGLSALLVVACQPVGFSKPKDGVVYCSLGNPSSLNPQLSTSSNVVEATSKLLYDRLVDIKKNGQTLIPALAERWEVNSDGTRYTFYLRKKVQFHSTEYFTPSRAFNAEDVVFSFKRIIDKNHPYHKVGNGDYSFFSSVGFSYIVQSIEAPNDHTVVFQLYAPDSTFLTNLASNFSVILSADYAEHLTKLGTQHLIDKKPIGTGPFYFYQFKEEHHIKYRAHEGHWRARPILEQVVFDITPDGSMRLAKLLTGECDAIASPQASEMQLIRKHDRLKLQYENGFNVGYWAFNTEKAPFNDKRVRRAVSHAIDPTPIMEAVYYGTASPASSLLPPISWGYDDSTPQTHYSPELAKELLEDAGYADGFDMDIWVLPTQRDYNPNAQKMALLIQENLKEIGIHAHLVQKDWHSFRTGLSLGRHDSVLVGWAADNADPDNFFRPLLSCQGKAAGTNRAMWCDERFDQIIDVARQTTDLDERRRLYRKAQHFIAKEAPLFPIAHGMRTQAIQRNIQGLQVEPFGGVDFTTVSIE